MIITPKKDYEHLTKGSEKRVQLQCDGCSLVTSTSYANYVRSQAKNNYKGKTYCRKCATKKSGKLRSGRPAWNKGMKFPELSGENSPSWKGGSYISSDGYRMIYVGNHNTASKWSNYKKEHVVVMEEFIGRTLLDNELVHHKDLDKLNNDINNLELLSSHKEHRAAHYSLEQISIELYNVGLIDFCKTNKKYVANDKLRELLEHLAEDNQQPS